MKQDEFAIVLSGGGAKGVYQIGVWKALRELGVRYNAVIGTSIGAINGALMVQGDYDLAHEMWAKMEFLDVVNVPDTLEKDGKFNFSNNVEDLLKFHKSFFANKGVDTTPLKQMIEKYISKDKVFKSKIDYGIVSYQLSTLSGVEIFRENMRQENFYDYLLASSALPGLKQVKIDGKLMFDGGIHDNIPFATARNRGYRNIMIVDISGLGRNRKPDVEMTRTTYIKNSADLGSIIEVDQSRFAHNMQMGYYDAMKVFGKYTGTRYTYSDNPRLKRNIESFIVENNAMLIEQVYRGKESVSDIRELLPDEFKSNRDLVGSLVECTAIALKVESDSFYTFDNLIGEIKKKSKELDNINEKMEDTSIFKLIADTVSQGKDLFSLAPLEYSGIFSRLFRRSRTKESELPPSVLTNFMKEIYGARFFFALIEQMNL